MTLLPNYKNRQQSGTFNKPKWKFVKENELPFLLNKWNANLISENEDVVQWMSLDVNTEISTSTLGEIQRLNDRVNIVFVCITQ